MFSLIVPFNSGNTLPLPAHSHADCWKYIKLISCELIQISFIGFLIGLNNFCTIFAHQASYSSHSNKSRTLMKVNTLSRSLKSKLVPTKESPAIKEETLISMWRNIDFSNIKVTLWMKKLSLLLLWRLYIYYNLKLSYCELFLFIIQNAHSKTIVVSNPKIVILK